MLMTRVITAVVLLAVLTLSIYIGPFAFASVMAIAFGATLYEWLRIGGLGLDRPFLWPLWKWSFSCRFTGRGRLTA